MFNLSEDTACRFWLQAECRNGPFGSRVMAVILGIVLNFFSALKANASRAFAPVLCRVGWHTRYDLVVIHHHQQTETWHSRCCYCHEPKEETKWKGTYIRSVR